MHSSGRAIHSLWPSFPEPLGGMLGLPFVISAGSPGLVFEWQICLGATVLTILSSFVIFVPLVALMANRGQAMQSEMEMPPLALRTYVILFLLWTAAAWLFAVAIQLH